MNVLLVEDDERIIEFVRRGLEAEGYGVEIARTGRDALQRARSPGCGRDVCRQLRAADLGTPILMLTALDTLEDKVRGLRMGADDYLAKPFAFEELVARVQALARRGGAYRDDHLQLRAHDLMLDRATREVRRGDRPIHLTPREFALLECLLRAPGKVLSRPQILEEVWGCSTDPLTNVVDVYIRQLRRKLDRDRVPLIQTVRGCGYKIRR